MNTDTISHPKVHHGRNMKRLRDILGVKQETIALELDITQQAVSKLEAKELIDDETLEKVAKIFKVSAETIKNFDEDKAVNIISNTFNSYSHDTSTLHAGHAGNAGNDINYHPTFNPIDKIVELYERMLEMEKEKNKK